MIKNRSFMIGLGCGLAGGALLLQLMISAGMATPTKAQIAREASKLNLKVTEAEDKLLTAEEWQALAGQDAETQGQNAAGTGQSGRPSLPSRSATVPTVTPPAKATAPSVPVSPSRPSSVKAEVPTATSAPPSAPTAAKTPGSDIVLRIPSGVYLSEVADLLSGAGVIKNKDEFLAAAAGRKAQTRIQYGLYNFKPGQTIDSIIDELVTVKE